MMPDMQHSNRNNIIAVVVVVVGGALLLWWSLHAAFSLTSTLIQATPPLQ